METKEYIVALKPGVDYNQFWNEMESSITGITTIPARPVAVAAELTALDNITHYFLTDSEAQTLRQDPRVIGVEIPAELRDDIFVSTSGTQLGPFTKTTSPEGNIINWGISRSSYSTNIYGNGNNPTPDLYNYTLDGSNVDIVIVDSGIQANHPEFQYTGNAASRVVKYNWNGSLDTNLYYNDYNGHGTLCAGVAAGKNYGWGKNCNIYAIKTTDVPPTDPYPGPYSDAPFNQVANVIVAWHNAKSINPATGVKNPTVVNLSIAYFYLGNLANGQISLGNVTWRGNTYAAGSWPNTTYGLNFLEGSIPARINTYDAGVDTMIRNGIVVIKAAGNNNTKIDLPTGPDWNNRVVFNGAYSGNVFYMRGSSPQSNFEQDIVVGALDTTTYNATTDQKATYSAAGPGVDVFAAGSNVKGPCSNNNNKSASIVANYFANNNFKQIIANGTSFAAPQLTGICTLLLQQSPTDTPANIHSKIISFSNFSSNIYSNVANTTASDYNNNRSQWGGSANIAYQPVQGLTQVKTAANQWRPVQAVFVKNASNQWEPVKNTWANDNGTWKQTYTAP